MSTSRILIVENNPINLKLASVVLEAAGYTMLKAGEAGQAFANLRELIPDLILMDLAFPGTDALTLTRYLKENAKDNAAARGICIVSLAAFALRNDAPKDLDTHITRPIDSRKIPYQLADLLRQIAASQNES